MLLETFNTLLHDPAHWEFELLVGLVEMVVFDLLIGVLVWPRIKRHIHHDVRQGVEPDNRKNQYDSELMGTPGISGTAQPRGMDD